MFGTFTEADFENALISIFYDQLGYGYQYGPTLDRNIQEPMLKDRLLQAIHRVNPTLPLTIQPHSTAKGMMLVRNIAL